MKRIPTLGALGLALTLLSPLSGKSLLPAESIALDSLHTFKSPAKNWVLGSAVGGDPRRTDALSATPGRGVLINVAPNKSGDHLITAWEHGDIELSFDFLMPQGSNSGVYLMGRYELQLLDSWGVETPSVHDCGAIYERWIDAEKRGYEGTAPRVNATRAPGLWQTMRIVFKAPRFDAQGRKIANARFVEVEHNGFLIHQNVEVTGPTRGAKWTKETPSGPILIQGNHGPVAFRNLTRRLINFDTTVALTDLKSTVRSTGKNDDDSAELDDEKPLVANQTHIDVTDLGKPNKFIVTYTGTLTVPNSGTYAFDAKAGGSAKLSINGQPVLIPINPGVRSVPIELAAGAHSFQFDYNHSRWGKPSASLFIEGPNIALHQFGAKAQQPRAKGMTAAMADEEEPAPTKKNQEPKEIIVTPPPSGVTMQRGFTPFDPKKRLYSAAVGSSTGVHYAYDFDTATILRAWSGPYLDLIEFWSGRAHNQYLNPIGPTLDFHDKPTIALLESGQHDWPVIPDPQWSSAGYTLDATGQPTFFSRLAGLEIEDQIIAGSAPRRLDRHLKITGEHTSWMTAVLLAEADSITPEAGGQSFVIGDRAYYLDLSADNKLEPFIRRINGRDQLILYPPKSGKDVNLSYTLVW